MKSRITCLSLLFAGTSLLAQNSLTRLGEAEIMDHSKYTSLPNFIKLNTQQQQLPENFVNWATYALGLPQSSTLKPYEVLSDEYGYTHTRHRQYHNGYPVEGTQVISHARNGKITIVNGDYYQQLSAVSQASLTENDALKAALKKVNAQKYMWENDAFERASGYDFTPVGQLVYVHKKNSDYSAENMRLAYKFNIYAEIPLYRANVFVDAVTGEILDEQNLICTATVVGTGVTKYSGTVTMSSDNYGTNQYRLRETGRGNGVNTYNLNHSTTYTNTDFTNTTSTWNLAGNDKAASDAHWGAEKTYDYYKLVHGRNSIDNSGYALNSYMHYSNNYVNAFWNGQCMTYGDGDGSQFGIMTALDVCGHEITHGLVSFTASLNSGGEPGALNEAFADIFGTSIEAYARPTQNDWLMGHDIGISVPQVRDLSNEHNSGEGAGPNCYQESGYWDATTQEVHINSGPAGHWYYLLCTGGSGTSGCGNAYSVTAIGMSKAEKIAFRGLTVYFTASTSYTNARAYTIQAATDIYGNCSPETKATTDAWFAVNVGAKYSGTVLTVASTPSAPSICMGSSVTLTASGATSYTWTPGSATTSTVALTPTTTTTYTLSGTTGTCTGKTQVTVSVAPSPTVTASAASATVCSGSNVVLTGGGASTYTWSANAGSATTSTVSVAPTSNTTYTLTGSNGTCTNTSTVSVAVTSAPNVTAGANTTAICSGSSAVLTAGGASTYTWSANAGSATTSTVSVSPTSNTTYTVTGANGSCTATNTVSITVNAAPTVTASANNTTICNGASVTLTGGGATTYTWSANAGSATTSTVSVSPTANTTYTVTGASAGCSKTATVSVNVTALPNISASSSNSVICNGQSTTLTGTGGTTYTWSANAGSVNTATATVSPTANTTYTVTGTSSGCTNTATVNVTVNPTPSVTASSNNASICSGSSAVLTAGGASTYTWSANAGSATTTTVSVTPSGNATYTVTGLSAGCSGTATVSITVNPTPSVTASASSATVCSGSSVTLTGAGASSYTWSTNAGSATTNTVSLNPTSSATYTVTGMSGSCTKTATVHVTVNALPNVNASSAGSAICNGNSVVLTASGASTYTWSSNAGSATTATVSVSPGTTATYTVTGKTGTCTKTATVSITVNPNPTISVNSANICSGNSGTLTASGASTYTWSPATGLSSSTGSNVTANPVGSTTYTVSGTDLNGCTNTATSTVSVAATPTITANSAAICSGQQTATLSANGASSYSWSPATGLNTTSGGTVLANPSTNMTYTITGTTGACSSYTTVAVTVNALPSVLASVAPGTICSGANTTLSASGASNYNWSANAGSATTSTVSVTPTTSTTYTVTGTDVNGCVASSTVAVIVNATPTTPTITQNGGVLTSSSATGNQWYLNGTLIPGATAQTYTPTQNGSYSVVVTQNGCQSPTSAVFNYNGMGIASAANLNSLVIFPNPSTDHVIIKLDDTMQREYRISILNSIGQLVISETLNGNGFTKEYSLASFGSGIYFVGIDCGGTKVFKKLLIDK